jgi:plastocyanin
LRSRTARVRLAVFAGGLLAIVGVAVPLAVAGRAHSKGCGATVKVAEHVKYAINQYVQDGMRFVPGTVAIKSGCALTFDFATRGQSESHSLSIVKESDLPKTTAQLEKCKICPKIASRHLAHAGRPPGPTNPIAHWIVNAGKPGFDIPGDSVVIAEAKGAPPGHESVTVIVSARAGTTLHFICGLHPWMQGKIIVE